jgi:hypothetical protein
MSVKATEAEDMRRFDALARAFADLMYECVLTGRLSYQELNSFILAFSRGLEPASDDAMARLMVSRTVTVHLLDRVESDITH